MLHAGLLLFILLLGLSACSSVPRVQVQPKVLPELLVTGADPAHFRPWYQQLQTLAPMAQWTMCQQTLSPDLAAAGANHLQQLGCGLQLLRQQLPAAATAQDNWEEF